jgi:hypothetical protein
VTVTVFAVRAFYVIGPAFAAWAVLLAIFGFTRPDWPARGSAQRIVIAISLLLMLAVIGSATINAKFEKTERAKPGAKAHAKVGSAG